MRTFRRRAGIVGFANGLPLPLMELKNVSKEIRAAYEQNFKDYQGTVPHLFHHNAFVVLANGVDAKIGSVRQPPATPSALLSGISCGAMKRVFQSIPMMKWK